MTSRCDPAHAETIDRAFSLKMLDQQTATIFGLSGDDRIIYLNGQWDAFARANGGHPRIRARWDLGASYVAAIPDLLLPFYRTLLARARRSGDSLHPLSHQYECSTPTTYRRFSMLVFAVGDGPCLLVVNSLVVERPFADGERPGFAADDRRYRDDNGMLRQCCHCRRVLTPGPSTEWRWVPQWVEHCPPNVSHGLCDICHAYYYARV